ncbi:hypothetical protein AMK21_04420 [Streptomyces sp. CB00316]|nr:hypothetical protein AMK21_04420 [Streptomyces sp. CB00316]
MHYVVGRSEEVLDALPVAVRDRAAASRLPPWRAEEYAASRTLLRALLREIGKDLRVGPVAAHPSGRPYLPEARRRSEFAWIFRVQEACVKAVGRGLSGRPWNVSVNLGQQAGDWGRVSWCAPRGGEPVPVGCAWNAGPQSAS